MALDSTTVGKFSLTGNATPLRPHLLNSYNAVETGSRLVALQRDGDFPSNWITSGLPTSEVFPDSVLARTAEAIEWTGASFRLVWDWENLASCHVGIGGLDLLHRTSRWSSERR